MATIEGRPRRSSRKGKHQTGTHQQGQFHRKIGGRWHNEEQETHPRVKRRYHWELPDAASWEEEEIEGDQYTHPTAGDKSHHEEQETRPRVKRRRHWELPDEASREEEEIEDCPDTPGSNVEGDVLPPATAPITPIVASDPVRELDNVNLLQHYDQPLLSVHHYMEVLPTRPRPKPKPSMWIRRQNDKPSIATQTSTSGSKVKRGALLPASATIAPITTSDYTIKNYMPLPAPIETSTKTLENDILVPTLSKTSTHTLENDMLVLASRKISTHTLEIEDDALVPATTMIPPVVIFDPPFLLLRLPRELRDQIYAYLTPDEAFWIGRPPVVGEQKNAVVESDSMHKSAALIKSKHSLIFACRDTRDEFRSALWRAYVDDPDRQAAFRVYDIDPKPIGEIFNGCTTLELPKVLSKGRRQRVRMYLTGDLRRYRGLVQLDPRGLIQTLIMRWVAFCDGTGLDPMYSFSGCTWENMAVVDLAISQGNFEEGPEDWDGFQTDPHFVRLVPFFRRQFGRLFLAGSLDQQDQMIERKWRF